MEEQRIGHMYWNNFKAGVSRFWYSISGGERRVSVLMPLLLVLVLVVPGVLWTLHMKGRFGALKREVKGANSNAVPVGPRPGGADPLVLTRTATTGNSTPEFTSATMLPGVGMDLLQVTAYLPGHGEIALMAAPTVQQMADGVNDHMGANDTHGAIEMPWSGMATGLLSPIGTTITAHWRNNSIEMPVAGASSGIAEGGLLTAESADIGDADGQKDGVTTGNFSATSFGDRWPSKTQISTTFKMAATTLDITVTAKNVGDAPEPMGIGWHPRFSFGGGERQNMELKLPGGEMLAIDTKGHGQPTGKLVAAGADVARFQGHAAALGDAAVEAALVNLKTSVVDDGVTAEMRNPAAGYGLRIISISNLVKELRVSAPASASYVSLGMQTNYDDAFGREWDADSNSGIATLLPGATMQWKIRLEIFPVGGK